MEILHLKSQIRSSVPTTVGCLLELLQAHSLMILEKWTCKWCKYRLPTPQRTVLRWND